MGIPAWAAVLAAPYAADKLIADPVGSIYGTYKAIRDDQADQNDKQATMDLLKQFTADPNMTPDMKMLSKFRNPAAADEALKGALKLAGKIQEQQSIPQVNTLQSYADETGTTDPRFFNDPASREELQRQGFNGDLSFFSKGYSQNPVTNSAARDIEQLQRLGATQRRIAAGTANPNDYADLAMNPAAEKMDKVLNTNMSALKENRAQAQKAQDKADVAGFQGAIAGLTSPSETPVDLKRFSKRGGYAPFPDVESDIRQAAAAYNVGDSDEVNKAVDAAKGSYKDTYLPTEEGKIGRTSYTGQKNLLGDFRKDVQNVAPVTRININSGGKEGGVKDSDMRAWLNDGRRRALSNIKLNKPDQLAILMAINQNPGQAAALTEQLERSMTPEQIAQLDSETAKYLERHAPDAVVSEYKRRLGRTPKAPPPKQPSKGTIRGTKTINNKPYFQDAEGNWWEADL